MFFTLQFPFADIRPFLAHHPQTDLSKIIIDDPLECIEQTQRGYVRSFGSARLRGYIPDFRQRINHNPPPNGGYRAKYWEKLNSLWSDEYCYFGARRGLLFKDLGIQDLAGRKLRYPRAKVRSLHLSRYDQRKDLWSPCMRVEAGIYYVAFKPLDANDLRSAILEFLQLPTMVPISKKLNIKHVDGPDVRDDYADRSITKKDFVEAPLIEQKERLANLILHATTNKSELRVLPSMVTAGEPLLTLHYFSDELACSPKNVHWLPDDLTEGVRIGYFRLRTYEGGRSIGTWLFELPSTIAKTKRAHREVDNQRRVIRNYTIAIMRYWSEFRTALLIGNNLRRGDFGYSSHNIDVLQMYLNKASRFLFTKRWHGANLDIVKNVINAYEEVIDDREISAADKSLQLIKRQVAKKVRNLFSDLGSVPVFVSYSQKDEHWKAEVKVALDKLNEQHQIAYFDDRCIEAGEPWFQKIMQSLDTASIAVLLVSENFLSSKFIADNELPRILELFQRGKLEVIPIWINGTIEKMGWISQLQLHRSCNGSLEMHHNPEQIEEFKKALAARINKILISP